MTVDRLAWYQVATAEHAACFTADRYLSQGHALHRRASLRSATWDDRNGHCGTMHVTVDFYEKEGLLMGLRDVHGDREEFIPVVSVDFNEWNILNSIHDDENNDNITTINI